MQQLIYILLGLVLQTISLSGLSLNTSSQSSICADTALIQQGILDYYFTNNATFHEPYYWWEGGLAFTNMIENAHVCHNTTFVPLITDALLMKSGDNFNFMPADQIMVEANDDLGIWGMTLLTAAERNLTLPKNGTLGYNDIPPWIEMAEKVYLSMHDRWINHTLSGNSCGGGLRWQIYPWNRGYNYKNTISNGGMFQMAARLGRFLNNDTYLKQADEIFTWLQDVNFVNLDGENTTVFDGASIESNCTDITKDQWSYNFGIVLGGAAYMYNTTNSSKWLNVTHSLWNGTRAKFFNKDGIMFEQECQETKSCNNDQRAFKGVLSIMLEYTSFLVPQLQDSIYSYLHDSAEAAAGSCDAGFDKHTCGMNWFNSTNDGFYGLGEQISALSIIQSLLGKSNDNLVKLPKHSSPAKNGSGKHYVEVTLNTVKSHKQSERNESKAHNVPRSYVEPDSETDLEAETRICSDHAFDVYMSLLVDLKQKLAVEVLERKKLELRVLKMERSVAKLEGQLAVERGRKQYYLV